MHNKNVFKECYYGSELGHFEQKYIFEGIMREHILKSMQNVTKNLPDSKSSTVQFFSVVRASALRMKGSWV